MKNKYFKLFSIIKESRYKGVAGVICLDSNKPGPVVGVTICTHGNEPCGLALVNELKKPSKGKVVICLNNLKATENYFLATTETEEIETRFIDINMNLFRIFIH